MTIENSLIPDNDIIEKYSEPLHHHLAYSIISFFDLIFSELSETTRGLIICNIHFYGIGIAVIYTFLFGGRLEFQIFLVVAFLISAQIFILRGCILTRVEKHYCKEKGTTMDIFLKLIDIPCTDPNRKIITLTIFPLVFCGAILIYIRETLLQTRM